MTKKKDDKGKKLSPQIMGIIITGVFSIIVALLSFPPFQRLFESDSTPTPEVVFSPTAKIIQTTTPPVNEETPTATEPAPLSASTLSPMVQDTSGKEMVLVPAGDFFMGSENGDSNEKPAHVVYLDAYYIDKLEVTNADYRACVRDGICQAPLKVISRTRSKYYGASEFDSYPVIYVDWHMAEAFCEWRGARLPTEAEWEKAARGENGFVYPWGDTFSCSKGNFDDENQIDEYTVPGDLNCDGYVDTAPVGSFPAGASQYGVLDLNGNVWEWVNSISAPYPYKVDDGRESLSSASDRIIRGGAFTASNYYSRSPNRDQDIPTFSSDTTGFRCAVTP